MGAVFRRVPLLLLFAVTCSLLRAASLVNFETAPIHPVALSPAGLLAVCNLPDGRIELFDVSSGLPVALGNVRVGVDPVSVRFRNTNELWVANHISRTISIVDVGRRRLIDTIATLDGPSDIQFAGTPLRAFVSCAKENTVQVIDPVSRQVTTNLTVDGERPKAMALSPDGTKLYVAIFESGNRSTILVGALPDTRSVLQHPDGPYGGQTPVPNDGLGFRPPINPSLAGSEHLLPDSLIVKKSAAGRWMDDNQGDWSEFISGTNAWMTGRISGWDLPDRDLAIIDTTTLEISYVSSLMNICMDVAVNPASGRITVVGTDGINERRFEPNLRGSFLRVNVALVDPQASTKTILDLNPHLDYSTPTVPAAVRNLSIGDPRGIVWNRAGDRGYVTGMGSRNLVVLNPDGTRLNPTPTELEEGPTGLVLDEDRGRLYVLNRFSSSLSVINSGTMAVITNVSLFDPTPATIKLGRKHLYDTRRNSGPGHLACASCHVDGRVDRLAWDLGDPTGELSFFPMRGNPFHPMKGPLVTQTFQDIIEPEDDISFLPLHWRGDRPNIESFNVTFTDLLARDAQLTPSEMQEFKDFLSTIHFPPNRFRNLDNSLPTNVPLPGFFGVSSNGSPTATPLPNGNAAAARAHFFVGEFAGIFPLTTGRCVVCHNRQSGRGIEGDVVLFDREDLRPLKVAQLRSVVDKLGMDRRGTNSRAGFGFRFDGRGDTLTSLFSEIFRVDDNQMIANMTAFLLAFAGPDTVQVDVPFVFVDDSQDAHPSVGKQFTLHSPGGHPELPTLMQIARYEDEYVPPADLIAHGVKDGLNRNWHYAFGAFQSDRDHEVHTVDELLALATPDTPLTFTVVPPATGRRVGIDRDEDGIVDRTESEAGFDPDDSLSHPDNRPPRIEPPFFAGRVHPGGTLSKTLSASDPDAPGQTLTFHLEPVIPLGAGIDPASGLLTWTASADQGDSSVLFRVRVTDNGVPPLSDVKFFNALTLTLRVLEARLQQTDGTNIIVSTAALGLTYRLQYKDRLESTDWTNASESVTSTGGAVTLIDSTAANAAQRFYRVVLEE